MCDCSRCSLGMLRRGSRGRRGKCGRSDGRRHFGQHEGHDRSIMSARRRCGSVFHGDRGVVRVGGCFDRARACVGVSSADTEGSTSKARGRACPFKPRVGHGFRTLLSHYLLPLALASRSPCIFTSAAPPLLALPARPRLRCRMDLTGPTTSVGTRTDYSVGPWHYSTCATRHLMAWGARTTVGKYSDRKLYMSYTM
jgi:hypothetical protein